MIKLFHAVVSFIGYTELLLDTVRYKFGGMLVMLWLSLFVNLGPLNSPEKLIHLPLHATLEILMLLVRIVLSIFKRWGFMLIFSAELENHVNVVLLAHFLSLLKHIKCDSIEFCSVQKGRENGHAVACICMYSCMYMSKQLVYVLLHVVKTEYVKRLLAESRAW